MSSYRGGGRDYDDAYERRSVRRSPPTRAPVREYEDVDVRIRERDRSRERVDRTPAFLREDNRRTEAGPLVLRSREVETIDRRRHSPSPPPARERSIRPRYVQRSPSPSVHVDVDSRVIERRRPRSPTPDREHEHEIRIIHREKERAPSPSPSPPPPPPPPPEPPVIRGPTIEREVITHYRDIDHGVIRLRQPTPSPPPPPPPAPRPARVTERETDIDINISRRETDVDIRERARSRSRPAPRAQSRPRPRFHDDEDIHIDIDGRHVHIDESHHETRRRARSEVRRPDYEDEANYITNKIDSRGRMGEAWHGATKDWTIVDVPPGTERVQMDGVGGGGAEVTWQRYNGVRRAKFVPERDGTPVASSSSTSVSDRDRGRDYDHELSVEVRTGGKSREPSRSRGEVVEEIRDRRISIRDGGKSKKDNDMWTEITKDLVCREAIDKLGYSYEETEFFFYVMQYLAYEDVLELVELSDRIRRRRRDKERYLEWERDAFRDDWDRRSRHYHASNYAPRSSHWEKYDNERIREHEVTYDRLRY